MPLLPPSRAVRLIPVAAGLLLVGACTGRAEAQRPRDERRGAAAAPQPFDFGKPLAALRLDADAVAARIGSFAWDGQVTWNVARFGTTATQQSERHHVRQLVGGEFAARADLDPGGGEGSATGKQVVYVGGMTYARSRWAPYRERPTDRGAGARRFRDQSFLLAADLAGLYGEALAARDAGQTTALGRRARRFVLSLSGAAPGARPGPEKPPPGGFDADTKRRLAFLDGRVPTAADGELLLDAESGAPLAIRLKGGFSEKDDPQLRVEFDLDARVSALGRAVASVDRPDGALPDDRKPKGVAQALEAAGLRKRAEAGAKEAEPEGDDEE